MRVSHIPLQGLGVSNLSGRVLSLESARSNDVTGLQTNSGSGDNWHRYFQKHSQTEQPETMPALVSYVCSNI